MADKSRPRRDAEMNDGGTKGSTVGSLHQKANQVLLSPQLRHPAMPKKKERSFPGGGKLTNGSSGKISQKLSKTTVPSSAPR